MMCGGGGGGALEAINPAFARCNKTESLWNSCRQTNSACVGDREADCLAMALRWKIASWSQPPSVSTTRGMKATPLTWQGRECLLSLWDFIMANAAPGVLCE